MKDDDVVLCEEITRKEVLLRAAYDLLTKCERSRYVLNANETTIFYDGAECDGSCLREDIAIELDIDSDTDPLPILIIDQLILTEDDEIGDGDE
jgi:hypothetical protein